MKRDFLKNFDGLSTEAIDAIMAENGRDIQAERSKYEDYDSIKTRLSQAEATIAGWKDKTPDDYSAEITKLQQQLADTKAQAERDLADAHFVASLDKAITAAGGRSTKAISALLDLEGLKNEKDTEKALTSAIERLKKEESYLFVDNSTPPRFGAGAGNNGAGLNGQPDFAAQLRAAAGLKNKDNKK